MNFGKTGILLLIGTIGLFGLGMNDAFGASPTITAYIANDPDDGDTTYGGGDTLTITTDIPTNATVGAVTDAAFVTGNFTFAVNPLFGLGFGADWTAAWTDASTLVITIINTGANTPVVGVSTVTVSGGNTIGDQTADDAGMTNAVPDVLSGDFGLIVAVSTDSCSRDCTAPTLGLSNDNHRVVQHGFSYNGNYVDVERWHTPYPLIKAQTGIINVLTAKIYDDNGINNINTIRVAFGVPQIGELYNSEVIVEYEPNSILGPQLNIIDKNHLLDNVKIKTWPTHCSESDLTTSCLMFRMEHMFRESPLDNVVGISVSDKTLNPAQFYFNDGIEVEGDSLNPPQTVTIPLHTKSGENILLTQIDRENEVWVDENENIWTKNPYDTWFKITPDTGVKIDVEPISKKGIQRDHAFFETYKAGQELLANQFWNSDEIQSEPSKSKTIEFTGRDRMDNPELQKSIVEQIKLAQEIFEKEFGKITSE